MYPIEQLEPPHRLLLITVLVVLLISLFVWYGTVEPDLTANNFPGSDELGEDPEPYIGEKVSVGGTVVSHDPLRLQVDYGLDGTMVLEIHNVDDPPPIGHSMTVFGTLAGPDTVHAETTFSRASWEALYMYVVSFIGGLWVLGRLLVHWRPDRDALSIVPRGDRDA